MAMGQMNMDQVNMGQMNMDQVNVGQPLAVGWQLDPVLLGSLLALALSYALAVGPLRARLAPGESFPRFKALAFAAGIVLTYLTEGSPLHDLAERYLFSAHMVQHLLISYLCVPLLLWATPAWIWRKLLLSRAVRPVARVLLNPLVAGGIFSLALSLWHLPVLYEAGLRNTSVHHAQHLVFMALALISWWPVMSPLPELPRLDYGLQILYLFMVSTVLQLPLFALVTFASAPFYGPYIEAPRIVFASALADQQAAGVVMKVLAMMIFSVPIVVIFFRWFQESEPARGRPTQHVLPR